MRNFLENEVLRVAPGMSDARIRACVRRAWAASAAQRKGAPEVFTAILSGLPSAVASSMTCKAFCPERHRAHPEH